MLLVPCHSLTLPAYLYARQFENACDDFTYILAQWYLASCHTLASLIMIKRLTLSFCTMRIINYTYLANLSHFRYFHMLGLHDLFKVANSSPAFTLPFHCCHDANANNVTSQ